MKKLIFLLALFFFLCGAEAISLDIKDNYEKQETIIGKFSGSILAPITLDQVKLKRVNSEIAFEGEIKKLGDNYFIWIIAPKNEGSYTLTVEDVISSEEGYPQVSDYQKTFSVQNVQTNLTINPGFVLSSEDFSISAVLYDDAARTIEVNYPSQREVTLTPGSNEIDFQLEEFVGNRLVTISLDKYSVPAYLAGQSYICGDDAIDFIEACDSDNLNGRSCMNEGFDFGQLACSNDCLSFDTADCGFNAEESCGSGNFSLCSNNETCVGAGGYWYGGKCNQYEEDAVCDSEHLGLCQTIGTCIDAGGYWYNSECNSEAEPNCDLNHTSLCLNNETCVGAGGYWYNNKCNSVSEFIPKNRTGFYQAKPVFEFSPRIIRATALTSEKEIKYPFRIINFGTERLENLFVDYDRRKFSIEPDENITIEPNGTAEFNLVFKNNTGRPIRGAALAHKGEATEFLLFEINFTSDELEVKTDYAKNKSGGASYSCGQLNGVQCTAGEICSGKAVESTDFSSCCVEGECAKPGGEGSKAWIGYLIAAIIILILLIVYVKYKKTGKTGNPMEKFSMSEKVHP